MFHGQPHCLGCDYLGPDFMCTWHVRMGVDVLVQDAASLALRTVWVADDGGFGGEAPPEDEAGSFGQNRVCELVGRELAPGERIVPLAEFFRFGEDLITDLSCPRCRQLLAWRHTGIS